MVYLTTAIRPLYPLMVGVSVWETLLATRFDGSFTDDDLVLAEYGATVVGIEILQKKSEQAEEKARNRAMVQLAVGSLSYSELEAIKHIFEELDGREGLLVASKIADRVGVTVLSL